MAWRPCAEGTPKQTAKTLNAAINETLQEPRAKDSMEDVGGVFSHFGVARLQR